MENKTQIHDFMIAIGVITVGTGTHALREQNDAAIRIKTIMDNIMDDMTDILRVEHAKETSAQRLKPDHRSYGTHLSHCYGIDDDPPPGLEGSRYGCKYGEDDICPAAMFPEPYDEYKKWLGRSEKSND